MEKKIQYPEADYYGEVNSHDQPHGKGKMNFKNGETYEGGFENGERHGAGVYLWPNGNIYKGNFMKGQFSGKSTFITESSTYEGMFYKGEKNGNGKMVFKNGDYKEGTWKKNEFVEGKQIDSYENKNGSWRYEGQIKNGKRNGYGKLYKNNKLVFEGQFIDDEFGDGNYNVDVKMEDGTKITGNIENGIGKKELPNGDYYDGKWVNWKFIEGKVRVTNSKGYLYIGDYKNSDRHGIGKLFEPSGKLMYEGEFRNGSTMDDLQVKIDKIKKFASNNSFNEKQGILSSLFGKKHGESEESYQNIINDNLKTGKLKEAIQNFIYYYLKYIPLAKNNEDLFNLLLIKLKNDSKFRFAYIDLVDIIHDHSSEVIKELWWDKTYDDAIEFIKNEKILKGSNGKDFIGEKAFETEIVTSEERKELFKIKKNYFKKYLEAGLRNENKIKKIKYTISIIEETESEWERWANYRRNLPSKEKSTNINKEKVEIKKENKKDVSVQKSNNVEKENGSNYGRKMNDGMYGAEETARPGFEYEPTCLKCGKKMKRGAKAIVTFSKISWTGSRENRKQFCTWKCAEAYHK